MHVKNLSQRLNVEPEQLRLGPETPDHEAKCLPLDINATKRIIKTKRIQSCFCFHKTFPSHIDSIALETWL